MYLKQDENLIGQIVLIDPYIHNRAKLSKKSFLDRVSNVKYLRTNKNSNYISFYITSIEENNNLLKFHDLVNKGIFDFDNYHVFAVAIEPKLYNWFKTTDLVKIQKQIVCWMAALYYFNLENKEIQERQVYKPLFEEVLKIVEKYYKDFPIPDFDNLSEQLFEKEDNTLFLKEKECINKYHQVCQDFYNSEPPEFLCSPFDYKHLKDWGVNDYYNFEFVESYLTESDWERIVVKGGSNDCMNRVESRDDLWIKWKHVYTTFDQSKNFVYSFYFQPNTKNNKPRKNKRETIPQNVKDKVWQRDNGMCVECGSKEKLEFDHIIPVVKGGSSTYRNIQLLCESCNRKKHDKI